MREYRPDEYRALCARHFGRVDLLGLFHARKLRLHQLAIEHAGWDAVHARLGLTKPFYDRFTPAISERDFRLRRGAPRPRARPARRAAAMSRAPGALALVLHTHMPYVEGFGTWPFGEEWLWEAIATCYLPLLDVLDAAPGRVTLSVTPVLGDQLEAPGALDALRGVPARHPARVAPARHRAAAGDPGEVAALEHSAAAYARAADGARARRPGGAARARTRRWTSAATHAVLPLLATAGGVRLQLATGDRGAPRAVGRLGRRAVAARVRARAVARPAARGGRGARDVRRPDRRARPRQRGPAAPAALAGRAAARADRPRACSSWSGATTATRRAARTATRTALTERRHQAWAVDGAALRPGARAPRRRGPTRATSSRAPRSACAAAGSASSRSTRSCSACTGTRASTWLRRCSPRPSDAGLRIAPLDELLAEHGRRPRRRCRSRRGARRATWRPGARPRAGGLAWRQRAAELRAVAAAPSVPDRALRELLALQSSDWAFLVTRATAGDYPCERAAGHEAAFEAALAPPASSAPALRNLAPHLAGALRLAATRLTLRRCGAHRLPIIPVRVSRMLSRCSGTSRVPAAAGGGERGTQGEPGGSMGRIAAGVRRSAGH